MALFIPSQQTLFYIGWRNFHHNGYLVAYHRQTDTVGVTKYGTCSCNNTDELFADETWELLNWEYKGSASDFYALCRDHRDMKLPVRKVEQEDFNAKWILRLHDVFCEWYEAGKPLWEEHTQKREENAIRGGVNDRFTEMSPEDTGDLDVDTFRTNPAIRDADKAAAVKLINSMGGEGANVTLQTTNDDGTRSEMNVKLSAGRVHAPPFESV